VTLNSGKEKGYFNNIYIYFFFLTEYFSYSPFCQPAGPYGQKIFSVYKMSDFLCLPNEILDYIIRKGDFSMWELGNLARTCKRLRDMITAYSESWKRRLSKKFVELFEKKVEDIEESIGYAPWREMFLVGAEIKSRLRRRHSF